MEEGDVVTLNTGGPPSMVVTAIRDDMADCAWIAFDGEFRQRSFPVVALSHYAPYEEVPEPPVSRQTDMISNVICTVVAALVILAATVFATWCLRR